jgi:hypothetical protein
MERLPRTNNYVSTKVSAISTKTSGKYGENGMERRGRGARWRRKKNDMGSVVGEGLTLL